MNLVESNKALEQMASVMGALLKLDDETPEEMAAACRDMAGKLTSAAAHWQRIAKQLKKNGAAGAANETRK